MKKPDLAKRIARQSRISQARAADELDSVVHCILSNLRNGQEAPLPGLGTFTRGPNGLVGFEREKGGRDAE
jgi:nucleoid DNA-binding protein